MLFTELDLVERAVANAGWTMDVGFIPVKEVQYEFQATNEVSQ